MKTLDVAVWHVLEYEHSLLDEISHGQFHEADTYVIKWHYMITQAGACAHVLLNSRFRIFLSHFFLATCNDILLTAACATYMYLYMYVNSRRLCGCINALLIVWILTADVCDV